MKKIILFCLLLAAIPLPFSCSDYLDTHPHSAVSPDAVTGKDLPALINGMYKYCQNMTRESYLLNDLLGGLVQNYQVSSAIESINMLTQIDNSTIGNIWNSYYTTLMQVNNVIKVASAMPENETVLRAKGAGHFMRAYIYLNLATHWGSVPVLTEPELYPDSKPLADVWTFVENDLDLAIRFLKPFTDAGGNYHYVTQDAAIALKARLMLYCGRKNEAAQLAESLIAKGPFALDAFDKIFRGQGNTEVIFAFQNLTEESSTNLSAFFYNYSHPNSGSYTLRPTNEITTLFDNDDNRKAVSWENIYGGVNYFNKYPSGQVGPDPVIVVRIAEMYLISAEAKGLNGDGLDRLNELRRKRGLTDLTPAPATDEAFIEAILSERDKELLTENHRWYDLVRTGKTDRIGLQDYQKLLPIPEAQRVLNPKLGQNPGY
jgi:hypothetical protein